MVTFCQICHVSFVDKTLIWISEQLSLSPFMPVSLFLSSSQSTQDILQLVCEPHEDLCVFHLEEVQEVHHRSGHSGHSGSLSLPHPLHPPHPH